MPLAALASDVRNCRCSGDRAAQLYAPGVNLGLTELVLITFVLIATLLVPALVLYLVFTAGRRRGHAEARQEALAERQDPDWRPL